MNEFKTKDKNGKDIELDIVQPTAEHYEMAQIVAAQAFAQAMKNGATFRDSLVDFMKENNAWNDEKERRAKYLQKQIRDKRYRLTAGGMKFQEGVDLCADIQKDVDELNKLYEIRNKYDNMTVEGIAETARFNCLVALCIVYKDNRARYFSGYKDYVARQNERAAIDGASKFADVFLGLREDFESDLIENKFLKKHGFVDEKLRPLKDGHLVDDEGRLINENGHYVNEKGELTDIDGRPVDADGNWIVEAKPFLDADGNPIE